MIWDAQETGHRIKLQEEPSLRRNQTMNMCPKVKSVHVDIGFCGLTGYGILDLEPFKMTRA